MIPRGDIPILGAGLTGLLLSIFLARGGFSPCVYERNTDPRVDGDTEGRSINLALAERGRQALARAGILEAAMAATTAMPGRQLHQPDGQLEFQYYGRRPEEQIYSITRLDLNVILMDAAEALGVQLRFGQRCIAVEPERQRIVLEHAGDRSRTEVGMSPLIAADGAGSIVRRRLADYADFGASEQLLDHGYKELRIPPTSYGAYRMNPHALHIWPRGGYMLIALPNPDGDFTATLFLPMDGEPGFRQLDDIPTLRTFIASNFDELAQLMPDWEQEFRTHPVGIMGTVRCRHWHLRGQVLLIGDAAHAIVPFHGQGMNAAFEDCYVFDELLGANPADWETLFRAFERAQRDNANAIADMALENYIEMRDTVRDPRFHLKKKLAFELERRLPDRFIPRYSMVMFHPEISYRDAYRRGEIQAALLEEFTRDRRDLNDVDLQRAAATVMDRLEPVTPD